MSANSRIIKIIQKLLALAGNNPNEAEAKAAAAKAHRMLTEHNLDMQQVRAQGGDPGEEYVKHSGSHAKTRTTEQKFIFPILQGFFFVKVVHERQYRGGPVTFWFVGTQTNVLVAQYVHDFLQQEFRLLWKVYKAAHGLPESAKQSYYAGLAAGLEIQLTEAKQTIQQERALVLVKDPKIEQFANQVFDRLRKASFTPMRLEDAQALNDGTEHGKNIRIRKGVESDRNSAPVLALGDGRKK